MFVYLKSVILSKYLYCKEQPLVSSLKVFFFFYSSQYANIISVTKIELDKETLIRGQSKLFKDCCTIE
jgi:hypothetical protein